MSRKSKRRGNKSLDKLAERIRPLVAEIGKLQSKMKSLGLFPHDRELLSCPKCKREEDVTVEGVLVTCRSTAPGMDSGLRFHQIEDRENWWRCPICSYEFSGDIISK